MAELVFVMTDVVGSTALWERHGDTMGAALERHDRVIHGAMERAGGRVFKHTGDGMIAVFQDADAAGRAGLAALSELREQEWGATGPLTVRACVHAGDAFARDGDYFGPALNRTARINGVGNPGQLLVSDAARQLMQEKGGLDLGEHRLRDVPEPMRLWQLDDGSHPPLRTLQPARHNLPRMPTEFVGRAGEIDELRSLLAAHQLVTITGLGGGGKTRLAVETAAAVADRFPGGVWFVDLAAETSGARVGARAVAALGLVQPLTGEVDDPVDAVAEAAADSATLLVVDNCEHLIDDVAEFAESILARAPLVTMLATSREALTVAGEQVWPIPSLNDGAVELFLARAAAVGVTGLGPHLDAIESICAELDRIPLAIELAASLTSSLSLDELAARLDDRFALLDGGPRAARRRKGQQTLEAMMEWSYGLLSHDEQRLLNELAVFAGSFAIDGAEAVATPTSTPIPAGLAALVGQSLIVPSADRDRYRLLETVRLYAIDRLHESGEFAATRRRHAGWVREAFGYEHIRAMHERDYLSYQQRARAEMDNVIAALEWADECGDADGVFSIFMGSSPVWFTDEALGRVALSWLDRIPLSSQEDLNARASWLSIAALVHFNLGDLATALAQFMEAASYVDELKTTDPAGAIIWCVGLRFRGQMEASLGDLDAALHDADLLDELATVANAGWMMRWMAWSVRADVYLQQRRPEAVAAAQRALDETTGMSDWAHVSASVVLLGALMGERRYDEVIELARDCLDAPANVGPVRLAALAPGVRACVELERYAEAFAMIETDFGPALDALRRMQLSARLTALATLLAAFGQRSRLEQLAAVALRLDEEPVGLEQRRRAWSSILGGTADLHALPAPRSEDLALDRVAELADSALDEAKAAWAVRL